MKKHYLLHRLTVTFILLFSSCLTQKKLLYLQYLEHSDNSIIPVKDTNLLVTPAAYRLMPYDNLFIRVITPDPQWSEIFNTVPTASVTVESAALLGYLIDNKGFINLPFVRKT